MRPAGFVVVVSEAQRLLLLVVNFNLHRDSQQDEAAFMKHADSAEAFWGMGNQQCF